MDEHDVLAERFEAHRARLRAVYYRTLGLRSHSAGNWTQFDGATMMQRLGAIPA